MISFKLHNLKNELTDYISDRFPEKYPEIKTSEWQHGIIGFIWIFCYSEKWSHNSRVISILITWQVTSENVW